MSVKVMHNLTLIFKDLSTSQPATGHGPDGTVDSWLCDAHLAREWASDLAPHPLAGFEPGVLSQETGARQDGVVTWALCGLLSQQQVLSLTVALSAPGALSATGARQGTFVTWAHVCGLLSRKEKEKRKKGK